MLDTSINGVRFDDCLKLGKRINEGPYLLPDPELFRAKPEDDIQIPANSSIQGATAPRPERLPVPTDTPMRQLDVFRDKRVMLSEDLGINTHLRKVLEDLIEGGSGVMTDSVNSADMYVCQWREGTDYILASRADVIVGNLSWLYYLVTYNEWVSPLKRLLHYPLPRGGLPGFQNLKITLSNYAGEARIYLENLVTAAGAEFTKSMKQDNTHLITARDSSEKCNAAREWGIEMVNHLWIEETYARCLLQPLTDPRYTYFPPRTNLSEIIGQTSFDAELLEEKYYHEGLVPSSDDPQSLRKPMHEKDRNSRDSKKSNRNSNLSSVDDQVGSAATPRIQRKSRSSISQASTPASNHRSGAGKENNTPVSTGSRSAKSKAASRISGLAPDIALYEKEKKRKGPVWGGERAANRIDKERPADRSSSPPPKAREAESPDEHNRPLKKLKTGLPEVSMRLLVTGYKGWINLPNKEDADKVRQFK
jgi:hypothetical protein